jgi:acyl-CoA synthetase (AMP-forming)/AMP-acid ligase II
MGNTPKHAISRTRPGPTTVPDLLAARAGQEPNHEALIVDGAGSLSVKDWQERARALAHGLRGRGLSKGDRVGLLFGNQSWLDFAIAYVAVQTLGAVAVPLSDKLAPAELAYMLADSGATALIHAGEAPDWPGWSVTAPELTTGEQVTEIAATPADLAQILYTSGTTARPKGVAATHANLTYGLGGPRRPFAHSKHLVHAFPIGTNAGQVMLMNALDAKPTVVTLPRFTPSRFARAIESYAAGSVFVVPAMAIELLSAKAHENRDLSCVRLLGSAAAPLPAAVAARLSLAFPKATIANYYTSTEASPAQTVMIYDPEHPGSVGQPLAGGAVRIQDDDGNPCAAGVTGEVWMRSPATTRAYYNDEEATRKVFASGWVRMGDLGYLDADGYLYLADRAGDVVKTGAHKVSTLQVEAAFHEHPAVADAAVVGLPHPVLGTQLGAAIVLHKPVPTTELRAFLAARLAPHEIPAQITIVGSLPRNNAGKVDKRSLQRTLA